MDINEVIAKVKSNIAELTEWLNSLSYSNGECYVLCVGFETEYHKAEADYGNTMQYVDGKVIREPYTIIPKPMSKHVANQIIEQTKFHFEGKEVKAAFELVRVDRWAKARIDFWKDMLKDFDNYLAKNL